MTNFNLTYLQIMKKFIITALTIVFLASCSSDPNDENIITNANKISKDLVAFKNQDDFEKTIKSFSEFKKKEDFQGWINNRGHKSLLNNINDSNLDQIEMLPLLYQAVLNENLEFKIGENIVNFKDGIFYETNPLENSNAKIIGTSKVELLSVDEKLQNRDMNMSDTYKEYKQFKRISYSEDCGNASNNALNFRLVHELKARKSSVGSLGTSELSMNFRMSYDAGNGWADANSTKRLLSYNLSGYIWGIGGGFPSGGSSSSFSISDNYSCTNPASGNIREVLQLMDYVSGFGTTPKWSININGSVTHSVNGDDYSNEWNHSINW